MNEYLFDVKMTHSEDSLYAVSHMQYDLFCTRNYIARRILSAALILTGAYFYSHVWGLMLIAYGSYLLTSTYSASNHEVKKLLDRIHSTGEGFPSSRYQFGEKKLEIIYHPGKKDETKLDPVSYSAIIKLGEDRNYFFLFPHSQGGYCVPKEKLGEEEEAFRNFVENKTGQHFYRRRPTPLQRLREWMRKREREPEHL